MPPTKRPATSLHLLRVGALVSVLALAACSTTKTVVIPSGAPFAGESPTSLASTPPVSPEPSEGPSTKPDPRDNLPSPAQSMGVEGSGTAKVTIRDAEGNIQGEATSFEFTSMDPYSFYTGPKGLASLTFTNLDGSAALTLGGYLTRGPQKTSANTSLTLFASAPYVNLTSGDGSCTVNVTSMQGAAVAGTFRCPKVPLNKKVTAEINGTFGSQAPAADA